MPLSFTHTHRAKNRNFRRIHCSHGYSANIAHQAKPPDASVRNIKSRTRPRFRSRIEEISKRTPILAQPLNRLSSSEVKPKGPEFIRFFKPILQILKQSGGSATTAEVIDRAIGNVLTSALPLSAMSIS